MSDYEFPDLPSDKDLGITDEDREKYEEEGSDRPEMSDAEMAALLGNAPAPRSGPSGAQSKSPTASDASPKQTRRERRAEKKRAKEAKKEAKKEPTSPEAESALPPAPRSRWRGAATLAFLLAAAWVASPHTGLPRTVPANATDTAFSSGRAMSSLVEIAQKARPPGSPEHVRVRELLVDRLRQLGLDPQVQTTTTLVDGEGEGQIVRAATVRNIVGRIPGSASTGAVLITAHYDSRGISVGAADDGFGIVSILEAVRALQADEPLQNDVIVLLTDGEELGLLGATAFVAEHPWMQDVALVISLEMRGGGGASLLFETNQDNGWVIEAVKEFDSHPVTNSLFFEVYKRLPRDTDFSPFKAAGIQGLNFAGIGNPGLYHQAYDRPEYVSEATLQHHGLHALGALRHFGQADLTDVDAPDVVYFTVPGLGLISYGQRWILPLSGLLGLLLIGSVVHARRSGTRLGGIAGGLGTAAFAGGLSFAAAFALLAWTPQFHEESGSLMSSVYHGEGWYMLALAFAAAFSVTTTTAIARRWLTVAELALGAAILPVIGAIVLSVVAPLSAMNLQLPAMAGTLSVLLLSLLGKRAQGTVGWITALLFSVPVIVMLGPIVELTWIAMSIRIAGGLAVLMTVALFLCLPALDSLNHPNRWWAPLSFLVLGASALGIGLLRSGPSEARPSPTTLVYAYEHGTGAALWATDPNDEDGSPARSWAVEQASGPFSSLEDLSRFAYPGGEIPTATAPVIAATPPSVVVVSDTIQPDARRVTLRVRSRIGAEVLRFAYDREGGTRMLSLNGAELSAPDALVWAEYRGEPENDVVIELTMPPTESIGLNIVEHLLRPGELLGEEAFQRPSSLAPNILRMSDRAMFRYSVAAFADPRHAIVLQGADEGDSVDPEAVLEPAPEVTQDTLFVDTLFVDTITLLPDTTPPMARDSLIPPR
jgi:hypothetical protein